MNNISSVYVNVFLADASYIDLLRGKSIRMQISIKSYPSA